MKHVGVGVYVDGLARTEVLKCVLQGVECVLHICKGDGGQTSHLTSYQKRALHPPD